MDLAFHQGATRANTGSIQPRSNAGGPQETKRDGTLISTRTLNLAEVYRLENDYDKAERLLQEGLVITRQTLGETHPQYASFLNNLGLLHQARQAYAKAEAFFEQALEAFRKAVGEAHPDYAATLSNLARLYLVRGNFPKAEPLFQRALVTTRKTLAWIRMAPFRANNSSPKLEA